MNWEIYKDMNDGSKRECELKKINLWIVWEWLKLRIPDIFLVGDKTKDKEDRLEIDEKSVVGVDRFDNIIFMNNCLSE